MTFSTSVPQIHQRSILQPATANPILTIPDSSMFSEGDELYDSGSASDTWCLRRHE